MVNLTSTELERYRRQIILPGFGQEAQQRLKSATVLVTGVGGLGGTAALYLAIAGVGRLILVRGGELRLDDMNRQILMSDDWVGKPRVFKAKKRLEDINPDVEVEAIFDYVTPDNVDSLIQSADVALDCAHNFGERDLLNAACVRWRKPMVEAAMDGMDAYLTTIIPGVTPCLSCLFPEKPEWDRRGFGVLGAVSGTLACLTALEAMKLITGFSQPLSSELLTMNLHQLTFAKRRSYRDRNCPVCGTHSQHYPHPQQLSRVLVNSQ
ncbi:[sulfur carrier protein ThiS] adenylyltransferase [Trichormus variabilis ATCC 29413]|uniref:Protein HesA, vegetative n=2 Tax=Anabaena variabilis TaxID=264691 RepID=HESA2_TRIV2|nr:MULTISPECIES: HesA/MoeB/ThiF family protein [Nostocaceae]P46048.1 RecName: Full=Protein HesA, vegetative [Trichormus variabilis ATCC 29413]ABA23855.1 [sulfur carrier protein ThiS] adenylyltransferase [Trichormus variabilis ATCC 29413]MBC1214466.1 HesA/MoeB/ThiF family protein [Trichormus variabilis ARAD]MBC1256231.1 HesA/MoeB/ThiF family protein [Trichormus variabilis V5]MBC1268682.1 HesA/MoeB/ThiF family protein [Trichormus variabilis FSR]MBC1300426.1 HesA/MoeB/ThiF family protein [Tricho